MRERPPREEPPRRRFRQDLPRPEGPFDRLLRRRPDRDPAPIIIGGTIAFLAIVIIMVFVVSSVLGGGGNGGSKPNGDVVDIAPGIRGRLAPIPGLPPGLLGVSEFIEFETEDKEIPAVIGLPLREKVDDPAGLGFYTFFEARWQRVADVNKLIQDGKVAEGDFSSVPDNLAVLRVLAQTYQVAASLPNGATLHADAVSNILSPRDYAPAADGTVQGKASKVTAGGDVLLLPTIVGSSSDGAGVVNDILADDGLRASHAEQIVDLVSMSKLDGIDIEYSSVDVDLGKEFTDFVTVLADGLGEKRLSLSLPPPSDQRQAYDWQVLGERADIIKILPIADPISYWETMPRALGKLIEDVDPKKVILGVSPFSVEAAGESTKRIGYLQSMVLAAEAVVREPQDPREIKPGTSVTLVAKNLDEGEGASSIRWDNEAAAVTFAVGGTDRRRIFIENSFSVAFKLELVQAYGLAGLAISDGSAESDVANIWPPVSELVTSATISLRRPNDSALTPVWQAPDGGDIGAGAGTTATWIAPEEGPHKLVLVVSDGERRFGRETVVEVKRSTERSPTPPVTFPPTTGTATPTPTPKPNGATPTPTPEFTLSLQVGKRADGDDPVEDYENDEETGPGTEVTYRIVIDNDAEVPVEIVSVLDDKYPGIVCTDADGNVVGRTLQPDDGDAALVDENGDDSIVCRFKKAAPGQPNKTVTDVVTVIVQDKDGNQGTDHDDATIRTVPGP